VDLKLNETAAKTSRSLTLHCKRLILFFISQDGIGSTDSSGTIKYAQSVKTNNAHVY
jgi:hypothetical protein